MTVGEQPYQGDEALTGLLKKSGLATDLRQIRGLLAGVIAAPEGEHPDDWIGLVAPSADEAVRAQLRALKREVSASAPAPALAAGAPRLAALRKELVRRGLDGFLVPRADEHQGEYVPPRAERLRWLTGFTGSAGLAIVLSDKAAVFVDGRYTLQVRSQTDTSLFEPRHSTEQPPEDWIKANLASGGSGGAKIGYDPWLHTPIGLKHLRKAVAAAGGELVALESNPLDAVWSDQPPAPIAPAIALDIRFAGRSSQDKRESIG
ncbi:MAG TPA: aminopeptidase P family N-terminal domain-containing protein, partial [Dongiaceae bacterium]